jgi:hypothetical protein
MVFLAAINGKLHLPFLISFDDGPSAGASEQNYKFLRPNNLADCDRLVRRRDDHLYCLFQSRAYGEGRSDSLRRQELPVETTRSSALATDLSLDEKYAVYWRHDSCRTQQIDRQTTRFRSVYDLSLSPRFKAYGAGENAPQTGLDMWHPLDHPSEGIYGR